jgi:hypothetical protein
VYDKAHSRVINNGWHITTTTTANDDDTTTSLPLLPATTTLLTPATTTPKSTPTSTSNTTAANKPNGCNAGPNDAIVVWAPGKFFLVRFLFLSTN